jgi:GDP-4-dehydro-6-deoxy-D-mannose reductase
VKSVLVTGAGGFVGRWLVRGLLERGYAVTGALKQGAAPERGLLTEAERAAVRWIGLELLDSDSVHLVFRERYDCVVHLAAVSSGADARQHPGNAWAVNAAGTARILEVAAKQRYTGLSDPLILLASTGEVYGAKARAPLRETDPVRPCSPYAASKAGAELAALETSDRTGVKVIVARPFQQAGPGQDERFVLPALAKRLRGARLAGARVIKVGNLEPVRDFLDVRDVCDALLALLERGTPGEVYNVATGQGVRLEELFQTIASVVGVDAIAEADPELMRSADIPYLVGDASKLRKQTGWSPRIALEQTIADVVAGQADEPR